MDSISTGTATKCRKYETYDRAFPKFPTPMKSLRLSIRQPNVTATRGMVINWLLGADSLLN